MFDITYFTEFTNPLLWVKIAIIIFLLGYGIFIGIVYSQVKTMNKILSAPFWPGVFELIAILHLIIVIALLVYIIVVL